MRPVATIDCHVAGQPLRLIVDGLPPIAGATMAERLAFARDQLDPVRRALMREPRGHRDMTGALLTEADAAGAHAGILFLDADGWRGLCGHGLIGAATIALECGLLLTGREDGLIVFDTVEGAVEVRARLDAGFRTRAAAERRAAAPPLAGVSAVTFTAPPALVVAPGVPLAVKGRRLTVDLARCGGLYAIVDAEGAGAGLDSAHVPRLRALANDILQGLRASGHPEAEGVLFTGPPHGDADLRAVPVYDGGCLDRSPSGLGLAALTAVLDALGLVDAARPVRVEGASGLCLTARLVERIEGADGPSVRVDVTGSAWITGEHAFYVSPEDPLAGGWPAEGR